MNASNYKDVPPVIEPFKGPAPPLKKDEPGVHPLIEITWVDIIKEPGWDTHEDVELPVFRSVGWLVYEDDSVIKIADTLDEEGNGYGIMAFPKGVEMSRKHLKF